VVLEIPDDLPKCCDDFVKCDSGLGGRLGSNKNSAGYELERGVALHHNQRGRWNTSGEGGGA